MCLKRALPRAVVSVFVVEVRLYAGEEEVRGWRLGLEFSSPVDWLESVMGEASSGESQWSLASRDWDNNIPAGGHLDLKFLVDYSAARSELSTPAQKSPSNNTEADL